MKEAGGTVFSPRRVLVLVNPKSGLFWSFEPIRRALDRYWDVPGVDLLYQFSQSAEDGTAKARRAAEQGTDTVLVVGGDGTISTVGRALIGTGVALGAVPAGSGNGFARHFGIPLAGDRAVRALASATVQTIDVGVIGESPFLVTCSMAWDAALVQYFEKMPGRGILPYVFAGVQGFFEYEPQEMQVVLDSGERLDFPDPLVFTIANLTQYGGGAKIAPQASPDDGYLELVVAMRRDLPRLLGNLARVFDGSLNLIPEVISRRFQSLEVRRAQPARIQIDGEMRDAPAEVTVRAVPGALKVLVPRAGEP